MLRPSLGLRAANRQLCALHGKDAMQELRARHAAALVAQRQLLFDKIARATFLSAFWQRASSSPSSCARPCYCYVAAQEHDCVRDEDAAHVATLGMLHYAKWTLGSTRELMKIIDAALGLGDAGLHVMHVLVRRLLCVFDTLRRAPHVVGLIVGTALVASKVVRDAVDVRLFEACLVRHGYGIVRNRRGDLPEAVLEGGEAGTLRRLESAVLSLLRFRLPLERETYEHAAGLIGEQLAIARDGTVAFSR